MPPHQEAPNYMKNQSGKSVCVCVVQQLFRRIIIKVFINRTYFTCEKLGTITEFQSRVLYGELASLTTYFCSGVLWDHRVSGELWMEDAAVCVSVHGQIIQELTVLLHAIVERRVCIRNQLGHRV